MNDRYTPAEIEDMVGREIASDYEVVCHDARDTSSLVRVGDTSTGVPVWV